jgi:F0F1-type ATP synthase membrane subunit b/b'
MKKFFKYGYFTVVHILAGIAVFLIFTALAVKFKWTNNRGAIDENNRYFSEMAEKYDDELKKDSIDIEAKEFEFFQDRKSVV